MSVLTDIKATYRPMALHRCNWADRPSASSYTSGLIQVADVGLHGGAILCSNGTDWLPAGPQVILAQNTTVSIVNTLAATNIPSSAPTIPGNFFHPTAMLRYTFSMIRTNNSSTFALAGTTGNIFSITLGSGTTAVTLQRTVNFLSRSSQVVLRTSMAPQYNSFNTSIDTGSVDFSLDQQLRFVHTNSANPATTTVAFAMIEYLA